MLRTIPRVSIDNRGVPLRDRQQGVPPVESGGYFGACDGPARFTHGSVEARTLGCGDKALHAPVGTGWVRMLIQRGQAKDCGECEPDPQRRHLTDSAEWLGLWRVRGSMRGT